VENYIINNKSIAIIKKKGKTIIFDVDKCRVINKNIKVVLDNNCSFYGSSLEGRKKSAKKLLNLHYKAPIVVTNNIILIQLNSIRNEDCIFLVLNKIVDYKVDEKFLKILCINKYEIKAKISKNSFERLLINAIKLNNQLKWKKH